MPIDQLPLPYALDALSPVISEATLNEHYAHHHATYVKNANTLAAETGWSTASLQELILRSAGAPHLKKLFNNAAQAWNHDFFWQCLQPPVDDEIPSGLREEIERHYDDFGAFRNQFLEQAQAHFGSGWAWLVLENDRLVIVTTPNGDTPATRGAKPLFTIDVWEHAYYLDYQHDRRAFLEATFDRLANWRFVDSLLTAYRSRTPTPSGRESEMHDRLQRTLWREVAAAQA